MSDLPGVTVTAPRPAPPLSQLDLLLQQTGRTQTPVSSDFQRLITQPRADATFQELMKRDFIPGEKIDEVIVKAKKFVRPRTLLRAAKIGARFLGPVGLALGVYDALDLYFEATKKPKKERKFARFTENPDARTDARRAEPNRFADGDYLPTGIDVIGETLLDPVYVAARSVRPRTLSNSDPFGIQSLYGARAVPKGASNPKSPPKTLEEHLENIGYEGTRRGPLTRRQPEDVPSTKTQPQRKEIDKDKDTCVREKRDRNACPKRGYRIKILKTEKVPCQ